jgi:DNA-binding PadR family transcriptional regulator
MSVVPALRLTAFEQVLLGMICAAPSSGYDLKRTFSTTPMGVYQPSSGALYPALRRLESKGLVRAQAVPIAELASVRHRQVYERTPLGRSVNEAWVRTPIEPSTIARDLGLHLLRFVMMEPLVSRDEVISFLHDLRDALEAFVAKLVRFSTTTELAGHHPMLALDHGTAVYRASLQWVNQAIVALSAPAGAT